MRTKHRLTRAGLSAIIAGSIIVVAGTAVAATTCYSFSAMTVGTTYSVGDTLSLATSTIEFTRFQWGSGTWTAAGFAQIDASNNANGSPTKELELNNINVRVIPDTPAYAANYLYADCGGNVNFGVNGDFRNTADLIDLDGTVVGGCDITVTETSSGGCVYGEVIISPQAGVDIDKFGVGGQEFWIDDVCFDY